jgi:hypothetical protein
VRLLRVLDSQPVLFGQVIHIFIELFPTVEIVIGFAFVLMAVDMPGDPFNRACCSEKAARMDYVVVALSRLVEGFFKNA